MAFSHLKVHSAYSLQDSTLRIEEMVQKAKEFGMTHLALTDHHAMYGTFQFQKECSKEGITPIFGVDLIVDGYPIVVLAETQDGYANLVKLVTHANSVGKINGVPQVTKQKLMEYTTGLIGLSGGVAGEISQLLLAGDESGAEGVLSRFCDIFGGRENFFLEISNHGLPEEQKLMQSIPLLSQSTQVEMVATNDIHYLVPEHSYARAVFNEMSGDVLPSWDQHTCFSDQFYFKSESEMLAQFPLELHVAIANTQVVAKRCEGVSIPKERALPDFPVPQGHTIESYFEEVAGNGFRERYPNPTQEQKERLAYEIQTIKDMGFPAYFLIVWDFIHYAKNNGIDVGPGRGSAAGSMVAYCLRITDLEPMSNHLLFERFLNPARVTMPDIDIDFCQERRQEMIEYVQRKYGHERVAQIITFGTLGTKSIIKDIGRALGINYSDTDEMSKEIAGDETLEEVKQLPYFQSRIAEDDRVKQLFEIGSVLEGLPRHTSVHAAGVVISRLPLQSYVPLKEEDGVMITQWHKDEVEQIGLLKMDFLGLKTLTIMRYAIESIEETTGTRIDPSEIPLYDDKSYEMMREGKTGNVFQLESGGMQRVLKDLQPTSFDDIVAVLALYRPGPMEFIPTFIENKRKGTFTVPHPSIEPLLRATNGIIVYQEQIQQVAQTMAGYSLGEADLLRRAVSKKKKEVLDKERENFVGKATALGVDLDVANEVYDMIVRFAEYGFNRSHAAAYAVVTARTAYLKCHYPAQFMAGNLTVAIGDSEKLGAVLAECKRMGIKILPPDVRKSRDIFSVENGAIRYGLCGVRGIGRPLARAIQNAPAYSTFEELLKSIPTNLYTKAHWENLIEAGALDEFGNRGTLLASLGNLLDLARETHDRKRRGQMSFFDMGLVPAVRLPYAPDPPKMQMLKEERRVLNVILSGHPMDACEDVASPVTTCLLSDLTEAFDGQVVTVAGIFSDIKTILTKKMQKMAFAQLEDQTVEVETIIFPQTYEANQKHLKAYTPVFITGKVEWDKQKQVVKIKASEIRPILTGRQVLYIRVKDDLHAKRLTTHLSATNGVTSVVFFREDQKALLPQTFQVRMNNATFRELEREEYTLCVS